MLKTRSLSIACGGMLVNVALYSQDDSHRAGGTCCPCAKGHDRLGLLKWAHGLQRLFSELRDSFLQDAEGRATLCSYTSDAASFLTRGNFSVVKGEGSSVQRRGKVPCEFLSERLVLKRIAVGEAVTSQSLLGPPRLLKVGKQAGHCFNAACDIIPTWRTRGHKGLFIHHYCFDRALHEPLCRLLEAKRNALYSDEFELIDSSERSMLNLKDIFIETGCAAHDASGSLKWGLARYGSKTVHDNLFITIRSLRQCFEHLLSHLRPWLVQAC